MKKILITAYYYDFARFFNYVALELKDKYACEIEFVTFYPSASYYLSKYTNWVHTGLYEKRRLKTNIISNDTIRDYDFTIKCDGRVASYGGKIAEESSAISEFWRDKLSDFDLIISSGDTRPQTTIMLEVAKEKNINVIFFEQGPYGTTMLDNEGVNANISFSPDFSYQASSDIIEEVSNYKKEVKFFGGVSVYDRMRCYHDLIYMMTPSILLPIYPLYTQIGDNLGSRLINKFKSRMPVKNGTNQSEINYDKYVLLALQVPSDAQMISHSKLYDNILHIVKDVVNATPNDYHVIIREHPLYKNRYDKEVYNFINSTDGVSIENGIKLEEQIVGSSVVIVNNSMTGMDAILKGKSVVVLGESYYKHKEICFPVYDREQLRSVIANAINTKVDKVKIASFLEQFYLGYLLKGHFQDLRLDPSAVVDKINNYYKLD